MGKSLMAQCENGPCLLFGGKKKGKTRGQKSAIRGRSNIANRTRGKESEGKQSYEQRAMMSMVDESDKRVVCQRQSATAAKRTSKGRPVPLTFGKKATIAFPGAKEGKYS